MSVCATVSLAIQSNGLNTFKEIGATSLQTAKGRILIMHGFTMWETAGDSGVRRRGQMCSGGKTGSIRGE